MKKISFFIFSVLTISCQKQTLESSLSIPEASNEQRSISSLIDGVSIKPLHGELEQIPFGVEKISLTDSLILLGDFNFSQSLYAFDKSTGQAIEVPIHKGEGPMEVREVVDFWVDGDIIYVLDGVGRKILPISYSNHELKLQSPIQLETLARRFAKTETGFVTLTGGRQENELAFFDENGKLVSTHFPHSISYLMAPLNPFQKIPIGRAYQTVFHSNFDPVFYRVDEGKLVAYDTISFKGEKVQNPQNTDFVMDLEGFNQFRETLRNQPSMFMIFESTGDQSILIYSFQDETNFALISKNQNFSYTSKSLKNDLSFDYEYGLPIPKGATDSKFLTTVHLEQVKQDASGFEGSDLQKAILANPITELFLMEFRLKD